MAPDSPPSPEKRTTDLLTANPLDAEPPPLRGFATDNRGYFAHREQIEREEAARRRQASRRNLRDLGILLAVIAAAAVALFRWLR